MRLDRDCGFDVRMRFVIQDLEVVESVVEDTVRPAFDRETRQRQNLAAELFVGLFQMIGIKMAITSGPDEITDSKISLLCQHVR